MKGKARNEVKDEIPNSFVLLFAIFTTAYGRKSASFCKENLVFRSIFYLGIIPKICFAGENIPKIETSCV